MANLSCLRESSRKDKKHLNVPFFQVFEGCLNKEENLYDIELVYEIVSFCMLDDKGEVVDLRLNKFHRGGGVCLNPTTLH